MAQINRSFLVALDDRNGLAVVDGLKAFCASQDLGMAVQYVVIDERAHRVGHIYTIRTDKHTAGRKLRKLYNRTPAAYQYQAMDI